MTPLKKLNLFSLTLLIISGIDNVRNFPASALFGSTLVFFFVFAAITFLIPTALVSAELTANVSEGGIYQWCRLGLGNRLGFLGIWMQWISNVVWFPMMLSFVASTAVYFINPAFAQNKYYLVISILGIFWVVTLLNLKGIRLSAKFASACTVLGLFIPVTLLIVLLGVWLGLGKPSQIHFTLHDMLPNFHQTNNWVALSAIMLGFVGMELNTVHINDVAQPRRTFPKALIFSTMIILMTMVLGTLAIAIVLPYNQINLVNGTIQSFAYFLSAYHLSWGTPILCVLLVVGSFGGILTWVISPVKGLAQAAQHGFMPPFLQKTNRYGVPQNMLIGQGILVSLICTVFLLLPSVNSSFLLLTVLTTQMNIIMYVLMFAAMLCLRHNAVRDGERFCIPGGNIGLWITCLLGLVGCLITIFVNFIPPSSGINVGSPLLYEGMCGGGTLLLMLPTLLFCWYQERRLTLPSIPQHQQSAATPSVSE